jgi:hypothetical protein
LSPKRLMEYAIAHVRSIAFIRSKGTMNNFYFNRNMLFIL